MTTRQYSSRSQQTTLTGTITSGATSMTVVSGTTLLGGVTIPSGRTFTLVIDPDTALEEIVDATAVATNTFTVTRAIDGSSAQEHSAGAVVRHMAIGRDYRDANLHAEATGSYNDGGGNAHDMHGIAAGEGVVVGTLKTQTLTNKTLTSPTISNPTLTGTPSAEASIVFEGSTADAYETTLTVVDPTQDNTITLPNTTGTVTINDATQTLTNKTLTSPVISGTPTITGLSSAGMISSSATPKDYVDSILGSATAAATSAASAATSAASAATSASSASTSASSALTSANSASTSATAAATSATSAAASATAAATSATSAAASATTASNSAAAAATSATSAATSASSALTSANSASTSATSAANSATASATSASAAATSATSAAASATAAATSATSAAASATAAATSATSAAASAAAAATSASSASTSASSALTSANSADASAIASATSATAAASSATSAAVSATSAATSASSASTSASSALTSANSAAASWDQFDDRYLGAKSSAPSTDNDGNPLTTGVIYFNSTDGNMYVYDTGVPGWVVFTSSGDITAVVAGTGLSGGGTSGSVTLDLANTAVTAGNYIYTSLTVDAQGRITAASDGTTPVTSITGAGGITIAGTTSVPTVAVDSTVLRTTGGQVIAANTSIAALEIRQIGAGNALVVEDDTNPDATPFVIDASGNVGIGTSTPGAKVDNVGTFRSTSATDPASGTGLELSWRSTYADVLSYNRTSSAFTELQLRGNPIIFGNGGGERMRITSGGLLGIGGTPSGAMVQIFNNTAANVGTIIRGAASQTGDLLQVQDSAATVLARITSGGNVGIGASPSEALTVSRSTGEAVIGIRNTGTGSSWLTLAPGSSGAAYIHNTSTTAATIFTTNSTERMRVDASGNVGVGTSSMSGRFNVQGTAAGVSAYFTDGVNSSLVVQNLAGGVTLGTDAGGAIHLATNGSASGNRRLSIDNSGNTTINTIADGTTTTAASGGGFMGMPQNSTTTGSYTIVAGDAGKHIYSTATRTVTIPANGSVAFPVGTVLTFISGVGATTTIAITTDTMYLAGPGTTGSRTLAAYGMATAVKIASTTWIISGNGLT